MPVHLSAGPRLRARRLNMMRLRSRCGLRCAGHVILRHRRPARRTIPRDLRRGPRVRCGLGAALARRRAPRLRVTGFELLPVRATERTVWLIVRLRTDAGLTGLGEASDAFGFANTTREDAARMEAELRGLFGLVSGPLAARHRALPAAAGCAGRARAGAGHRVQRHRAGAVGPGRQGARRAAWRRSSAGACAIGSPVYANVNRATSPRTAAGIRRGRGAGGARRIQGA